MKRRPGRPGEPVRRPETDAEPSARPEAERPPGEPERVPHWFGTFEDGNFCPGIVFDEDGNARKLP